MPVKLADHCEYLVAVIPDLPPLLLLLLLLLLRLFVLPGVHEAA
jgi:hypothetical protein